MLPTSDESGSSSDQDAATQRKDKSKHNRRESSSSSEDDDTREKVHKRVPERSKISNSKDVKKHVDYSDGDVGSQEKKIQRKSLSQERKHPKSHRRSRSRSSSFKKNHDKRSRKRSGQSSSNKSESEEGSSGNESRNKRSRSGSKKNKGRKKKSSSRSTSRNKRSVSREKSRRKGNKSKDRRKSSDQRRRSGSKDKHRRRRSRSRSHSKKSRRNKGKERSYRRHRSRSADKVRYSPHRSKTPPRIRRKREFLKSLQAASLNISQDGSEASSNLPLSDKSIAGITISSQLGLQNSMAAMKARTQAVTGVTLPKYYNPAAINPLKYAEQIQKRKLLWSNKTAPPPDQETAKPKSNWKALSFSQDNDGKQAAKFKKMMGIKEDGSNVKPDDSRQAALFKNLDQQYEIARISTHTQRGVGLGFASQAFPK